MKTIPSDILEENTKVLRRSPRMRNIRDTPIEEKEIEEEEEEEIPVKELKESVSAIVNSQKDKISVTNPKMEAKKSYYDNNYYFIHPILTMILLFLFFISLLFIAAYHYSIYIYIYIIFILSMICIPILTDVFYESTFYICHYFYGFLKRIGYLIFGVRE